MWSREKEGQQTRAKRSNKEVFPLPSIWTDELASFPSFSSFNELFEAVDDLQRFAVACWCELAVLFVNNLSGGKAVFGTNKPTHPQREMLASIEASVRRVLSDDTRVDWGAREIKEDFGKRTVSYTREEVCLAEPLSLDRIVPGLPPEGHGGSVDIRSFVGDRTRWLLQHAGHCVAQSLPTLQGKVHIVAGQRLMIAKELVRRGICKWTAAEKVFQFRGEKVLNCLFGVRKSKRRPSGECVVLRLIMNLIPSNAVLRVIPGRVASLPSITQQVFLAWMSAPVRAHRQNVAGPSSSLIHEAIRVFDQCAELYPHAEFKFFCEECGQHGCGSTRSDL